eukprot:5809083-Pyramimonas_sp.AAC.1
MSTPRPAQELFHDVLKETMIMTPWAPEKLAMHCRHLRIKAYWHDEESNKPDRLNMQITMGVQMQSNMWEGFRF